MMTVVYTGEEIPETITRSVFLAGPTPRSENVNSWRPEMMRALEGTGLDMVVFCPEKRSPEAKIDYEDIFNWEYKCLNVADLIVFWVPRDIKGGMPAFTTNVEFGYWARSGKVVMGFPVEADAMRYLNLTAIRERCAVYNSETEVVDFVKEKLADGAERTGGERFVPLYIYRTPEFKNWRNTVLKAGNRIDNASVMWQFSIPALDRPFAWVLKVDVWIENEGRLKSNEWILSRPDIFSVVAYSGSGEDALVVIVKEFRSPANTKDGYIRECPGGSDFHKTSPCSESLMAIKEMKEETGILVPEGRVRYVGSMQLCGTLSIHKSHVFAIELTLEEMKEAFRAWVGNDTFGVVEDTERTSVEVVRVSDILDGTVETDWATVGMVAKAVFGSKQGEL